MLCAKQNKNPTVRMKTKTKTNSVPLWNRFAAPAKLLTAAALTALAVTASAQITYTPVFSKVWDLNAGNFAGMPANAGNNCRGIAINPVTTNVLYFSSIGGTNSGANHVGTVAFASGSNFLAGLNGTGVSGGTLNTEGVRVADDGTVYGINLSGSPASSFKIYKWPSDTDTVTAPTVVANTAGVSFPWRAGDYSDLRGSGTNTELVVVGNGAVMTNFVIYRPTDATCTTFTNFQIPVPGGPFYGGNANLAGSGVAFEGTNNAIWIRQNGSQNTRRIVYDPVTLTATCSRTNAVDQSTCQGLKYYKSTNGVELLATVQPATGNGVAQIARVFQVPTGPLAPLVSVLSSNLSAVAGSVNGNGLANVDVKNGYFAFGAPGHGISLFAVTYRTDSPPTGPTATANGGTFVAGFGLNAVLTGTAAGSAPLKFQWVFTNTITTNILSSNSTNGVITVSNVQTANAGSYYFIVTNIYGAATSGVVNLTVLPNGSSTFASPLWSVTPGTRPYLTGAGTDTQRGLGYAVNSNRVVLVTRTSHTNLNDGITLEPYGAILLDGNNGAEAGELDMSVLWGTTPAGTFPVSMCGVADDGVVYIANLITSANSDTFAIYSWPAADPLVPMNVTPAYYANPMGVAYPSAGGNGRIGDSMAVRGATNNTQILCTFRNGTNVCIFTTADGVNFDAHVVAVTNLAASAALTDPFTGSSPLSLGCAFGSGNTFWAKSSQYNLRQMSFNLDDNTAAVIGSYPINGTSAPLGVNNVGGYIGIIGHNELPMNLALYNLNDPSQLTTANISDRELFAYGTNSVPNGNGTGNVVFDTKRARVFALSSNNGVTALQVNPATAAIVAVPQGGTMTWTGPGILQSATDVSGPYTDVTGAVSPYSNTGAATLFFRVKR